MMERGHRRAAGWVLIALLAGVVVLLAFQERGEEPEDEPVELTSSSEGPQQPGLVAPTLVPGASLVRTRNVLATAIDAPDERRVRTRTVRIRVVAEEPAPDAVTVIILTDDQNVAARATVAPGRELVVRRLAWGEYDVRVEAVGLIAQVRAAWSGLTLVDLGPSRTVSGTVSLTKGTPLEGASVYARRHRLAWAMGRRPPDTSTADARTDAEGRFRCSLPRTEEGMTLLIYHPRVGGVHRNVPGGPEDASVKVNFGFNDAYLRRFHVVDEAGADVVPTLEWLELPEGGVAPRPVSSRFELLWTRRDPEVVLIDAPGFETHRIEGAGVPETVERIVMRRLEGLRVAVHDARGRAVPNVRISLLAALGASDGWLMGSLTDTSGRAWLPARESAKRLILSCMGFRDALIDLDAPVGEVSVTLAEDVSPLLVLPEGLLPEGLVGYFSVFMRDGEQRVVWEREYEVSARETTLHGMPTGPKIGRLTVWTTDFRHEITFEGESRILFVPPAGWGGTTQIRIDIRGAGDIDGMSARIVSDAGLKRSQRVRDRSLEFHLERGRAYTVSFPKLPAVTPLRFSLPPEGETEPFVWNVDVEVEEKSRWTSRVVDAATGKALPDGRVSVFAVGRFDNSRRQAWGAVRAGRVELRLQPAPRVRVLVEASGYARHELGPMTGKALLGITEIRVPRPRKVAVTWDTRLADPLEVFLVEIRKRDRSPASNLDGIKLEGGRASLEVNSGARYVLWARGGDVAATPRGVDPTDSEVRLHLEPTATLEVSYPERVIKGQDVSLWIEYVDGRVGYSALGLWRILPYPEPAARCLRGFDVEARTATLDGLPAGPAVLKTRIGDGDLQTRSIRLEPGRVVRLHVGGD